MRNQEELVKALHRQGFEATQSSVSRDLRELGVAKAGDHYIPPVAESLPSNPFASVANFVVDVKIAGDALTVVKTTTGTAQSVAVAIDRSDWPEVVGTISGDDTIFIATADARAQTRVLEQLREAFGV